RAKWSGWGRLRVAVGQGQGGPTMGALSLRAIGEAKLARSWPGQASLAVMGFALLMGAGGVADAARGRSPRPITSVDTRAPGEPVMAVVSLRSQQITVYDAEGWILRSPVSSGQKGRETPAGVFSVIQKQAEHYSNLYDDAFMPHMQRLTWAGI